MLENLFFLMVIDVMINANQTVLARVLRAMGKQALASCVYFVMLPIGVVTAFVLGWRVYGV